MAGLPALAGNEDAERSRTNGPAGREIRVYLVRRGDSLWKIARRFRMKIEERAELNGLTADKTRPTASCSLPLMPGGWEAYHMLYGKKRKLTAQYLYDPKSNFFHFRLISRTLYDIEKPGLNSCNSSAV